MIAMRRPNRAWLMVLAAPLSVPLMLAILFMRRPILGMDNAFVAGLVIGVGVGLAMFGLALMRRNGAAEGPGATAERLGRLRNRAVLASVVLFLASQGMLYTTSWRAAASDSQDVFGFYGLVWAIWSAALSLFLATGGGFCMPERVRRLINDEVSTANRAAGRSAGFYAMILAALGVYLLRLITPLTLDQAVHGVVTIGLCAAMLRYVWLERRADL